LAGSNKIVGKTKSINEYLIRSNNNNIFAHNGGV